MIRFLNFFQEYHISKILMNQFWWTQTDVKYSWLLRQIWEEISFARELLSLSPYFRNGKILLGSWRASVENAQGLKSIGRQGSNFYKKDASEVRDQFKEYFIKPEGEVPWQQNHISFNGNLEWLWFILSTFFSSLHGYFSFLQV